jgi:HAD superfamily hydrolase (TIGR01509 family)
MKAFIFDFDGVIIDSERYWPEIVEKHLTQFIPNITPEMNAKIVGADWHIVYEWLTKDYNLQVTKEEFFNYDKQLVLDMYKNAKVIDGFTDFITRVQQVYTYTALGTGAKRWFLNPTLDALDLRKYFNCIVSADEVATGHSKPAPDIYLKIAAELGVEPAQCIVLEDSTNGIAAAKAAGMYCIGINHQLGHNQDISTADIHVTSFAEIPLETLRAH